MRFRPEVCISILAVLLLHVPVAAPQTYEQAKAVYEDRVYTTDYNADVRPVANQSERVSVSVCFNLASIPVVDDVAQSFIVNGVLGLWWKDERLSWSPATYGGVKAIQPKEKDIWRPRVQLLNTLTYHDIFKDDYGTLSVLHTGDVFWGPGGMISASCLLDMTRYPYDRQTCSIEMMSMKYLTGDLNYTYYSGMDTAILDFFSENNIWDLVATKVELYDIKLIYSNYAYVPAFRIRFTIQRRPAFVICNVVLPAVCLSLLNILVFIIPVESGEKIGFGITCLLALAMLLSITSTMLPQSTDNLPYITVYLLDQLIGSTLTVVVSIWIVHQTLKQQLQAEANVEMKNKCDCKSDNVPEYNSDTLHAPEENHVLTQAYQYSVASMTGKDTTRTQKGLKTNVIQDIGGHETEHFKDNTVVNMKRISVCMSLNMNLVSFVIFFLHWITTTAMFFILIFK